jgi:predicted tellurium resistance membrane protein TerC
MDFFTLQNIISLTTLSGLEVVLGIDNVIFIALLVQHLEKKDRNKVRIIGLSLALILRILMLFCATWIMKLTDPLFTLFSFAFSGRNLLLIIGGLFLVVKAIMEVYELFHHKEHEDNSEKAKSNRYFSVVSQIIFIDLVLSFDSIITAVGMSNDFRIMVIAVVIAMIIMIISSNSIGDFIYKNPSIKVLALAFIGLVGAMLLLNGFNLYFDKGYLYFSFFFSGLVEFINIKLRKKSTS